MEKKELLDKYDEAMTEMLKKIYLDTKNIEDVLVIADNIKDYEFRLFTIIVDISKMINTNLKFYCSPVKFYHKWFNKKLRVYEKNKKNKKFDNYCSINVDMFIKMICADYGVTAEEICKEYNY